MVRKHVDGWELELWSIGVLVNGASLDQDKMVISSVLQ